MATGSKRLIPDNDAKWRHDIEVQLDRIERAISFGTAASGDKSLIYTQSVAATTWNIAHNLNKYPSVTVVDNTNTVIPATVTYTDANNLQVTFAVATAGKVFLN